MLEHVACGLWKEQYTLPARPPLGPSPFPVGAQPASGAQNPPQHPPLPMSAAATHGPCLLGLHFLTSPQLSFHSPDSVLVSWNNRPPPPAPLASLTRTHPFGALILGALCHLEPPNSPQTQGDTSTPDNHVRQPQLPRPQAVPTAMCPPTASHPPTFLCEEQPSSPCRSLVDSRFGAQGELLLPCPES